MPLLLEVLEEEGVRKRTAAARRRPGTDQGENRGYWQSFWDGLLEIDPELFEAYTEFSSVP